MFCSDVISFSSFSSRFKMGPSVRWSWLAALSCLLWLEVQCLCRLENVQNLGVEYVLSRGLETNSQLIFICHDGFYPFPRIRHICMSDGTWDPPLHQNQKCRPVECPDPGVLTKGRISPFESRYYVTNQTTYRCYSGYKLRGSSTRTCLPNGKWSGSTPICSHDTSTCADPGIPPGASREGNIFDFRDKVKYTCSDDLILVGSSERECQENGQWTGMEPACYHKYTYDTADEISEEFGNAIKVTLTTLQPANDTQQGRIIRISKTGILNIYIAVDISESINSTYFKQARNAIVTLVKKISSFTVSPNYEIIFFSSNIYEVVNILDFFGDQPPSLASLLKNVESFEIDGRNTGTNIIAALNKIEECMGVIQERTKEKFKEHRHVIILFTDGAYNDGGSPAPTIARIKNKIYLNHDEKTKEEYLDIYVFAIGVEVSDDDLKGLVAGKGGQHYFRLAYNTNLHKTFDQIIYEGDVVGICGLHRSYNTTDNKESKRKRYPWVAFVIVQGNRPKKCLGSLVSPQFVLTAAHCFQFGDTAQDVVVEIEDRPGSIIKKVKTFYLHPDFNIKAKQVQGVKEFYDYDVALVQLQDAVDISSLARPICIPCTQETSDALQLVGRSTCAQQENILLNKERERLSFLTKADPLVQEKYVFAKLGNNRNACIKKALTAEGINVNDSTIAVTENFLCTGGLADQVEQIACTGDSGGAVFKTYNFRTIQVGVVSWGTQSLCGTGGLFSSTEDSRDFHINLFKVVPFLKEILGNDEQVDYAPLKFLDQ